MQRPSLAAIAAAAVMATIGIANAQAPRVTCADDDPPLDLLSARSADAGQRELAALINAALERSRSVGAARAVAEAARYDSDETRAAGDLQAGLTLRGGPDVSRADGRLASQWVQGSAALSASQLLWDGGRQQALVDWRSQLAEAARLSWLSQQEQVALGAVSLTLERSRFFAHEQVYGQYARKMGCLVDALSQVVAADRGRASELLQARKSLQQAELARVGAASQRRQAEIRLQRLIGDTPVQGPALAGALQGLPPLDTVLAASERANEVALLQRQAQAAEHFVQAMATGNKPQLTWSVGAVRSAGFLGTLGAQHASSLSVGVALNVPLFNPGVAPATDAARWRARAAREQLDDTLEARRARVREVHEQAQSSLDRAERVQRVLQDSQQLRNATQLQWQQLGRRSLFDVMGAESEHYNLRVSHVNALIDAQQLNATLQSLGAGLTTGLNR